MPYEYNPALQLLRGAVEIDLALGKDRIAERLKPAMYRVTALGSGDVRIPAAFAPEIVALKATIASFEGPDACGKWIDTLTERECVNWARQIVNWLTQTKEANAV